MLSYSGHTRRAYGLDLVDWFGWCASLGVDPLDANRAAVDGYRRHPGTAAAPSTIARRLSSLAGYCKYAVAENVLGSSPMEHVTRPSMPADSPTLGLGRVEAKALLAQAAEHSSRVRVFVALLLHDGLRISEALNADVTDLGSIRGHRTLTITRKGGARRDVSSPRRPPRSSTRTSEIERPAPCSTKSASVSTSPGPSG